MSARSGIELPLKLPQLLPFAVISVLLILFFVICSVNNDTFSYNREAIMSFQLWRALTGHFSHFRGMHLLLNLAGVWFLWLLFAEYFTGWRFWFLIIYLVISVSCLMLLLSPEIETYVGFSAVLYGLFIWGALEDLRIHKWLACLVLVVLFTKTGYEYACQSTNITGDISVATDTHFYAVLLATVLHTILRFSDLWRSRKESGKRGRS